MKKSLAIAILSAMQYGCASYGADETPLLSYAELSAEITVVRTPVDETLAAAAYSDDFLATE